MRGPALLPLLVLCFLSFPALAASVAPPAGAHFAPFGPGNGRVAVAADHRSGTLYAGFELGGLFRSADGGRSWTWSGRGLGNRRIEVVAVGPSGEVYAAATADRRVEVLGSFDQGASWSVMGSMAFSDSVFLRPGALVPGGEPGTLYFKISRELWKSADRGRSWSRLLQTKLWFNVVAAGPPGTEEVYVGTAEPGAQVLRSADGGATWTELQHGLPPGAVTGLAVTPGAAGRPTKIYVGTGKNGLFASTDGGATWQPLDPPYGSLELCAVAVDAADPATVYAAYRARRGEPFETRISRDGGATWQPGGVLMAESPPLRDLELIVAGSTLYASSEIDLAASSDRGTTWSYRLRSGVGPSAVISRLCFVPGDPATVHALVGGRAFKSVDGGRSWTGFATSLLQHGTTVLRALALDPARPATLYAAGDLGIFKSSDGGESWRHTGPEAGHLAVLPGGVVLAGGCGLVRTADAGATWTEVLSCQAENGARRQVEKLLLDPVTADSFYAAVREETTPDVVVRQIYRSRDAGRTWRPILAGTGVLALSPRPPAVLYAIQGDRLLASRDGGDTFQEAGPLRLRSITRAEPVADLLVDREDPAILYAATRGHGLLRSTDGGATWVRLAALDATHPENQDPEFLDGLTADPARPGVLYAAFKAGAALVRVDL